MQVEAFKMNKVIKEAKSKQVEAESNVAFLSIEN